MKNWAKYGGLLAAGVLTTGVLTTGPASARTAAPNQAAAVCRISAGSVTAGGDHRIQTFAATAPITRTENRTITSNLWPDGQARLSSSWVKGPHAELPGVMHDGLVVLGDVLQHTNYIVDGQQVDRSDTRVGGGWTPFRTLEKSQVLLTPSSERQTAYAIRSDGTLYRWNVVSSGGNTTWHASGTAGGYAGIKSMALISQTKTYDTFLMNGRDGALLTVHIPTTSPMKPVVKKVRASTWQGFETMMAAPCGGTGARLLAIDKDTGAGYLYAVGHGATVIQGLGKVPGTFTDPVQFGWHEYSDPKLNAE